ncbi:BTB/POZ domain-containing protein At5g47800 [Carica papaya]|uniref:BTB/POZ domain-containing protein At5g47800 n=1 Tax=Carica papaya TaxID=3649 RepID=UPI000B8D0CE2|nr:BTB/POZ domain-containing protein At5g47800 [Carica papaya]
MKFMKLGTKPDTFYTEEATRTLISEIPSDLVIRINNISYLLHKFPLLPKCGLLQRLCSDSDDSENVTIDLHDIPGGEDAFELCAKFCYGIAINLSAHNFVAAFCAAKFLRMTESIEKGNFVLKLEAFFTSCILEGWKDTIVTLQMTAKLPEWSENLGIIRRCIDSVVEKILTPPLTYIYIYNSHVSTSKQEHPEISKADKKRLCRGLDCQKLSSEVRAHAVKNERLPLRTVVQVLFFDQEGSSRAPSQKQPAMELLSRGKQTDKPGVEHDISRLQLGSDERTNKADGTRRSSVPETSARDNHHRMKRSDEKMLLVEMERKMMRGEIDEIEFEKGVRESRGEGNSGIKLDPKKILQRGNRSDQGHEKGRDR